MKFARIIERVAVDVIDGVPAELFHPDVAAEFVEVPSGVVTGSRLVDGEWTEPEAAPPPPEAAKQMAIIDFLRLFRAEELVGFNRLQKDVAALATADYADPEKAALVGFEVFLTHYQALRAGLIELNHAETIQGLSLLVPLGVLTEERLQAVLAGDPPA